MKTYYAIWSKKSKNWLLHYEYVDGFETTIREFGAIKRINQIWIWDNKRFVKVFLSFPRFPHQKEYEIRKFTTQDALLERCKRR